MKATRVVRDRLDHELAMIHKLGYSAYFLTVAQIVDDNPRDGIRCACRGSAAGSLVCYLAGISDVDAVRHDLAFERFLNPLRDELPDIDIDVESARREDVYDMVLSRHGDDRTACVTMVDTYRPAPPCARSARPSACPSPRWTRSRRPSRTSAPTTCAVAIERLPELAGANLKVDQLQLLFRVPSA